MFWTELCFILVALMIGARIGGVFLGMVGGLGVGVMVFIFGLTPSTPPIDVILIILSVVLAAASFTGLRRAGFTGQTGGKNSASPPALHYVISAVYLLYLHFYVRNGACRL